jgi:hypothetical protein
MSSTANIICRRPSVFGGAIAGGPDQLRVAELRQLNPPVAVGGGSAS